MTDPLNHPAPDQLTACFGGEEGGGGGRGEQVIGYTVLKYVNLSACTRQHS